MVSSLDTRKDDIDALKAGWRSLSQEQLQKEMVNYYAQGKLDEGDALRDFIREKNNPLEGEKNINDFGGKYDQLKDGIKKYKKECAEKRKGLTPGTDDYEKSVQAEQEEVTKRMENFFKGDVSKYIKNTKDTVTNVKAAKDKEIDDLKKQLSGIVSEGPKLGEYLSLERRRLVTINSKIGDLKKNTQNYPKNVLVYLMALTQTSLFGARQGLKRAGVALTWRWKTDNIKDHLQVIEDKIRINDGDSLWTQGLKKQIKEHLREAKEAYVKKQSDSVGLAA